MSIDVIISVIANHGVAVAVAIYLVWWITTKLNSKLDKLAKAIESNTEAINELIKVINRNKCK